MARESRWAAPIRRNMESPVHCSPEVNKFYSFNTTKKFWTCRSLSYLSNRIKKNHGSVGFYYPNTLYRLIWSTIEESLIYLMCPHIWLNMLTKLLTLFTHTSTNKYALNTYKSQKSNIKDKQVKPSQINYLSEDVGQSCTRRCTRMLTTIVIVRHKRWRILNETKFLVMMRMAL